MIRPEGVRVADPRDEAALYEILITMHAHNRAGWGYPYSAARVLAQIEIGTRPDPRHRTDPSDQRRGLIGVAGAPGRRLAGTVGVFAAEPMWFSERVAWTELWMFVRPDARDRRRIERDLWQFVEWSHAAMKAGMGDAPFNLDLHTGFMHGGSRFDTMARFWRRMTRSEPFGMLFRKP